MSIVGAVLLLMYFFLNREGIPDDKKSMFTRDIGPWIIVATLVVLIYKMFF